MSMYYYKCVCVGGGGHKLYWPYYKCVCVCVIVCNDPSNTCGTVPITARYCTSRDVVGGREDHNSWSDHNTLTRPLKLRIQVRVRHKSLLATRDRFLLRCIGLSEQQSVFSSYSYRNATVKWLCSAVHQRIIHTGDLNTISHGQSNMNLKRLSLVHWDICPQNGRKHWSCQILQKP